MRKAVKAGVAAMKHHPDTAEGRKAHKGQQEEWIAKHGPTGWVTETKPYPLRLGTAPVGSNECYRCGMVGHRRGDCTVLQEKQLMKQEQSWRSICGKVLKEPVNMRWVGRTEYDSDSSDSDEEGNVGGSSTG